MSQDTTPPTAVTAAAILDALHELDRLGHNRLLRQLETNLPDLTGHALESLSRIHRDLLDLGAPARPTRALYRRIEALTLVLIQAGRSLDPSPTLKGTHDHEDHAPPPPADPAS